MKLVSRYLKGKSNPKPFFPDGKLNVNAFINFTADLLDYHSERMKESSIKRFHTRGCDSLFLGFFNNRELGIEEGVFKGSFQCFVRILSMEKENGVNEEINVHNHGFSFNSVCISEEMENLEFVPAKNEGQKFTVYNFKSALANVGGNGTIFLENGRSTFLSAKAPRKLKRGENYQFSETQLHTIKVPKSDMGTYIVFVEGRQCEEDHKKLLFVPGEHSETMEIKMDDFYKPLPQQDFDEHWNKVFHHLQEMKESGL